jgi:hypothetical protein
MPNAVFFHIATIGSYVSIMNEMVGCINSSGILNNVDFVGLGVVGNGPVTVHSPKFPILYRNADVKKCEFITLKSLQDYCKRNHSSKVLYIHTKGVSTPANPCIDDWRKYMSYFLIEKYKDCISYLDEFDTVGVDWRTDPVPHFSGNFWWAKGGYIASLPCIEGLSRPDAPHVISVRHNAEFWIGMNKPKTKILWDCGINQYSRHLHRYPREMYQKE